MAYGQRSITSLIFKWQNGNGHGNILQSWAVLTNLSRVAFRQVRQRLADWVREIGVDDEHLSPNHAWRHTFKLKSVAAPRLAIRSWTTYRTSAEVFTATHDTVVGQQYASPMEKR